MEYRTLGLSGLRVSAVGLGCMGMSHAYGAPPDRKDMTELLAYAVDMGYTLFDTAEVYGTPDRPHDNEELLGEALRPFRNRIVIATKFGLTFDAPESAGPHNLIPDSRPETIRRSVEESLIRLRTDHIDLYYQHRTDPYIGPEAVAEVMEDLIKEGKILHWGISEATEEYLRMAHRVCPVAAVQNRYSMMARKHEALFPTLEELGIGFVAFSPLANGLLTECYNAESRFDSKTDYRASMPQFRSESFEKNKTLFALLDHLAEVHHATPSQVALAWMLNKHPWIVPIPGTRLLSRLKENAGDLSIIRQRKLIENIHGDSDISTQSASIMNRFLRMLEEGTYREHREVTYYADKLCVTPKYLSEVSKKASGYGANYWINRYTILDITRLLRDKSLSFVDISDIFGFSSPAYFSRYVQQNLGMKPSDYRD